MTTPDTADAVTVFCGAQVSTATAEVYGFQMPWHADSPQREDHVKIEKADTAHVMAYHAALANLNPATQARVVATVRAFFRFETTGQQVTCAYFKEVPLQTLSGIRWLSGP